MMAGQGNEIEIEFVCYNCGTVNHATLVAKPSPVASGEGNPAGIRFVQCSVATCLAWNKVEIP